MATKNEMIKDINEFYLNHQILFEHAGIPRLKFFKWLDSLEDWDSIRKANSFMFTKIHKYIMNMHKVFIIMPDSAWRTMLTISRTAREVILLKERIFDIQECWKNRPKPPRGPE